MFNAERFRLMKDSAYFINIGRGKVCKIDDLGDAIEGGDIAGCGLDVFEEEPLPSDHKLWGLPNVLKSCSIRPQRLRLPITSTTTLPPCPERAGAAHIGGPCA